MLSAREQAVEDQKRSFLRMVSHELRISLNLIIGFSEIIADELYGPLGQPQYKNYAEHVRANGLKFSDFKLQYHTRQLEGIDARLANSPVELPNDYDAVRRAIDARA